jgi:DNA-binding beta-propeller fold protein YncE
MMSAVQLAIHRCLLAILIGIAASRAWAADTSPPLVLEATIPLPHTGGRIDHMAVDLRRGRLFLAELGNGTLDVIDIAARRVVQRVNGLKNPQGVGYSSAADIVSVASAGDGSVRLFRGDDLSPIGVIDLGDDADNVRVHPRSGQIFVGYGKGGLAVIDPASRSVLSRAKLPAHPEGFGIDVAANRAYVNVPDVRQIAVVDLRSGQQIATWRVPGLRSGYPMALDETEGVLATAFWDPARLVLFDTANGAVKANTETCGDADDVFFDAKRRRIYVSCGEGLVDVQQGDATGYHPLARIPTHSGARTALFVPELDRLFVAVRAGLLGTDASLLLFRPMP